MIGQMTNAHSGAIVSTCTDHHVRHRAAGQVRKRWPSPNVNPRVSWQI